MLKENLMNHQSVESSETKESNENLDIPTFVAKKSTKKRRKINYRFISMCACGVFCCSLGLFGYLEWSKGFTQKPTDQFPANQVVFSGCEVTPTPTATPEVKVTKKAVETKTMNVVVTPVVEENQQQGPQPTYVPTAVPSTPVPTVNPTITPTVEPTVAPTEAPVVPEETPCSGCTTNSTDDSFGL